MCPTEAQRLRLVCSETRRTPSRYFWKSRLDSPWPCVTMQKRCAPAASAARACSRICSGLHHRVHRRLGVGEARLRAEAAVLGAAAGLRVDQRAHVGRVGEALDARLPRALDQRFDLGVVLDLAEREGLLASDQRRHARQAMSRPGRLFAAPARRALLGERAHPLAHVLRGERGLAQLDQLAPRRRPGARPRLRSSARDHALVAASATSGALAASSAASSSASRLELARPRRRG